MISSHVEVETENSRSVPPTVTRNPPPASKFDQPCHHILLQNVNDTEYNSQKTTNYTKLNQIQSSSLMNTRSKNNTNLQTLFDALSTALKSEAGSVSFTSKNTIDDNILKTIRTIPSVSPPVTPSNRSFRTADSPIVEAHVPVPKLTLSAYRRPEASVRLTDCPRDCFISQPYYMYNNRVLGHGASSTVRLAVRRSDGEKFAVKCIPKYSLLREKAPLEEVSLLRSIEHPNIVSLVDVYETENEIQLVMEYCSGGELFEAINSSRSYSEKEAAKIISSLLSALSYLHSIGIVHRDVKPENILLFTNKDGDLDVKLSDFGTARDLHIVGDRTAVPSLEPVHKKISSTSKLCANNLFDQVNTQVEVEGKRSRAYSRVGSDFYSAPEVDSGQGYGTSADLYSLGVTMYIMLCGKFPPVPSSHLSSDLQIQRLTPQAKNLIQSLLDPEPSRRISASDALNHDWIQNNNFSCTLPSPLNIDNNSNSIDDIHHPSSKEETDCRRANKRRKIDLNNMVDIQTPLFETPEVFERRRNLVIIDSNAEDESSSIEIPLRPICLV